MSATYSRQITFLALTLALCCAPAQGRSETGSVAQVANRGAAITSAYPKSPGESNASSSPARVSSASTNLQPVPRNPARGLVLVAPSQVGLLPKGYLGLSYAKSRLTASTRMFTASGTSGVRLMADFIDLGPGTLRLVTGDSEQWTPGGAGQIDGQIAPSDVQALAAFLHATGWRCIYAINFLTNTPAHAAAEAQFVSQQLGSSLAGFEIGNEPDGIAYRGQWTASTFPAAWRSFALAIRASVPGAQFAGPGIGLPTSVSSWTAAFMAANSDLVMWDTSHFYAASPNANPLSYYLSFDAATQSYFQSAAIGMKTIRAAYPAPWVIEETSEVWNGGQDGISNVYGSALYSLDFAFQAALQGAYGVDFMSGGMGTAGSNPYSVIEDDKGYVYGVQPKYAGMYLFALATQGASAPLVSTTLSAGGINANAYTLQNKSGMLSTVIVNRSAVDLALSLSFPQRIQGASILAMSDRNGPSDKVPSGVLLQGASIPNNGPPKMGALYAAPIQSNGSALVYVPAFSAALVQSKLPAPLLPGSF